MRGVGSSERSGVQYRVIPSWEALVDIQLRAINLILI